MLNFIFVVDISLFFTDSKICFFFFSFCRDDKYYLTDLGSRNGTYVNGKRMSVSKCESDPVEIGQGTRIQIGRTKMVCHVHPGEAEIIFEKIFARRFHYFFPGFRMPFINNVGSVPVLLIEEVFKKRLFLCFYPNT